MSDPILLNRFSHEAMTTFFEVLVRSDNRTYAEQAANAVFREIDRLEGLLSRFDPCSDISQLSRLKPGESIRVAPDVFECLSVAAWAYAETGGAFDATVGPVIGYQAEMKRGKQADKSEFDSAMSRVGMRRLELDDSDFSVGVCADAPGGVEIDLGGVGKGYALDKGADILEEWGFNNYLLNAGFSTALACGDGDKDGGWLVGVGGQWGKAAGIESIRLYNEALNGSGTEVKGAHIVDPATGFPATGHLAAWSVCPSATAGDALSTAFMVMPTEGVRTFCAGHDGVGAFVVDRSAQFIVIDKKRNSL